MYPILAKRLQLYLGRLHTAADREGWRAVLDQILQSLRWRFHPSHIAMRGLMRENEAFDARHGTDTRGEVPLEHLGIEPSEAKHGNGVYRAIPASQFRSALSQLNLVFNDYTFVDYGSGKGKALLLASDYPFRGIVGVEFSRILHEAAQTNIRRYKNPAMRCDRIEALHADARHYEPPDGPLVCFFFNPFDSNTWREVLGRLQRSFASDPRTIHIVYVNVRDVSELENIFPAFWVFRPVVTSKTALILSAVSGRPSNA